MSEMISKSLQDAPAAPPVEAADLLSKPIGRRGLLGAAGAAAAAAALFDAQEAEAAPLAEYFSILATGEALFVTFYVNALRHHADLDLHGDLYDAIWAIATEEQIHYDFAVARGGTAATTHFSFPHGIETFRRRDLFWQTQQLAEELTNGALLAWINDMAAMGRTRLAQIGGQLMQVEGGHRVVGRVATQANPWDNWAFGPVAKGLKFLDVPTVVKSHGFLSPTGGNDFVFTPLAAALREKHVINTTP